MTPRELEEYRALRATIQSRGTTRVWIFLTGVGLWAALALASAALTELPLATLVPLLVLAADFEIVYMLHTGVERIGRYVQVFFEDEADPGWERRIMAYGRLFPGAGPDPLFSTFFAVATILNFVPVLLAGPMPVEYLVIGAIHVIFILRLALAHRTASRQRAIDLERFSQLKNKPM